MGAGASLPAAAGDTAWFMALIDTERREKQWLAEQYDAKCAEARALQQEMEQIRSLLATMPETGISPVPAARNRPEFVQLGLQPAADAWQLAPVKEHRPAPSGQETPHSPSSPASPTSSTRSLKERRGLHLSVDTSREKKRSPIPPQPEETAAEVAKAEAGQSEEVLKGVGGVPPDHAGDVAPSAKEPKEAESQAPPGRRGSLSGLRPPSLLREDRIQRRSLGNLGDVEALQALSPEAQKLQIEAQKVSVLNAPASPKRLTLTSQKTWGDADR
mmetsp:Transcript_42068/g.98055  ORF Transcript_42068/g.98055 Transcript_42068/m.98055 type:complete len:273 (+) Transcript_42068:100-918(+)